MKFSLFLMFVIFFAIPAHAERFQSKIHSIDTSDNKALPHLIKLENGRVVLLDFKEHELLETFRMSLDNLEVMEIEMDQNNRFVAATSMGREEPVTMEETRRSAPLSYNPTVLSSYTQASNVFLRMRRNYQNNSQCYNRAHIWQYEEYKKSGLNSLKIFLFFTNRYIRNYRYKWWFHVSPMVLVKENGKTVQRVLDRRYMGGPRYVRTWTNTFVSTHRACPVAKFYTDYSRHQESQDCYVIPVSQYFWQPRDIEARDDSGSVKTQFIDWEVEHAYWEAF